MPVISLPQPCRIFSLIAFFTEAKGNVINFELRKKTWKPEGMPVGVMFVMVAFKFEIGYFDTRYLVLFKKKIIHFVN